ncbi:hypothetical protein [Pseudooctadecabacter sp.]|uniref:hypothetical protein n=1 Tax=Pseudooctadecabacter sp. TaxID=1966338 RepID=UPI0025D17FFB|nr:hypothetical protein [Pseudooctadecabacter sp.]
MTAIPDTSSFISTATSGLTSKPLLQPQIKEHFWGYEIAMSEAELGSAAVIRLTALFAAMVFATAALGLMLLPAGLAPDVHAAARGLGALVLICSAGVAGLVAARCRRIKVQIDTLTGEIREVSGGIYGSPAALSCHGLDAVTDVRVVVSNFDSGFGQVHVDISGYGTIAAGDGAVATLGALRGRIAHDCGLQTGRPRDAVWSGPLAA